MKYEKGDRVRFIHYGPLREKKFVFEGEIVGYKLGYFTGKVKWYKILRLTVPQTVENIHPDDVINKI